MGRGDLGIGIPSSQRCRLSINYFGPIVILQLDWRTDSLQHVPVTEHPIGGPNKLITHTAETASCLDLTWPDLHRCLLSILSSTVPCLRTAQTADRSKVIHTYIHRESKKGDTILLSISLLNIDRFSQFFHRRTQLEICNKIINKDPTSPQMCCYTTLWNVKKQKN